MEEILREYCSFDISKNIIEYTLYDENIHTMSHAISNDLADVFTFVFKNDTTTVSRALLLAVNANAEKIVRALCQDYPWHDDKDVSVVSACIIKEKSINILADLVRNRRQAVLTKYLDTALSCGNVAASNYLISQEARILYPQMIMKAINSKCISVEMLKKAQLCSKNAKNIELVFFECARVKNTCLKVIDYVISLVDPLAMSELVISVIKQEKMKIVQIFEKRGFCFTHEHLLYAYKARSLDMISYFLDEVKVNIDPSVVVAAAVAGLLESLCASRGTEELELFGKTILYFTRCAAERQFVANLLKISTEDELAIETYHSICCTQSYLF